MAGNVKVGGNVIATHTGVEGAGTVTLSNVTASGIKMSSSGNTITDSAGNAVLSESSGTVNINKGTVGSSVVFPTGHVIQTVYKNTTVTNTELSGSNTEIASTFFNKTITAKGNNSIFVIHAFVGKSYAQSASNGKVQLTRTINSTITSINQLESGGVWGGIAVTDSDWNPRSYCWVDSGSSCSVGNTIDYIIKFVRYNTSGNSFYFIDGSNNGAYCSYVIQEIAA